jgi:hypothetical protein
MALPVYMDVHVPASITAGLRLRGLDVLTSQEDQTDTSSDEELLRRATLLGRIFFSQDEDLLQVAAAYQRSGTTFSGVIYAHQMSAGIGILVSDLEVVLKCCSASELESHVMHLPLA